METHKFKYLEIYQGNVVQKREMDFEELEIFKAYQFEYFKTINEYNKVQGFWKNNNPGITEAQIDEYIFDGLLKLYSKEMFDNELGC